MSLSPILYLFQILTSTLYQKFEHALSEDVQTPLVIKTQCRPGPKDIPYDISPEEWPTVIARVVNEAGFRQTGRYVSDFTQALAQESYRNLKTLSVP